MEKASSMEMEFDGWELLPDYRHHTFIDLGLSSFIDMDYFSPSHQPPPPNLLQDAPAKTQQDSAVPDDATELDQKFKDIEVVLPTVIVSAAGMKKARLGSPKYSARDFSVPTIEPELMNLFNDEDEEDGDEAKSLVGLEKGGVENEVEEKGSEFGRGGFWRWRLMGIGTLCSIGVAAASICIFILGGQQRQRQLHQHHHHQRLQFQIYTDNQRIKQVVQQASRLNQAFTTVRGVPMARAHISFGGYYDGL